MLSPSQVEELNDSILSMSRSELVNQLTHFQARYPIDFTPDFYRNSSIEKLRHILFGLCLQNPKSIKQLIAA